MYQYTDTSVFARLNPRGRRTKLFLLRVKANYVIIQAMKSNWKDLAPNVFRKRLVIEAKFSGIKLSKKLIEGYLKDLTSELRMTVIFGPLVHPFARGFDPSKYDGYEGILIWAESGVSFYSWERFNFFTVDIYTCSDFNSKTAVEFTKKRFHTTEVAWKEV